jgi:hypothetical protein
MKERKGSVRRRIVARFYRIQIKTPIGYAYLSGASGRGFASHEKNLATPFFSRRTARYVCRANRLRSPKVYRVTIWSKKSRT